MIFQGLNDQYVTFNIQGYERTEPVQSEYEDNWLNIFLKFHSNYGDWQMANPYLLTFEVQKLIDWLKKLSCNVQPATTLCEFLEPNLTLELMNDWNSEIKEIRIIIKENSNNSAEKTKHMDFHANNTQLFHLANELRLELNLYPVRNN